MFGPRSASSMLTAAAVAGLVAACGKEAASSGAAGRASDSAPVADSSAPLAAADVSAPPPAPDTPPAPEPRRPVGHPVLKPRDSTAKRVSATPAPQKPPARDSAAAPAAAPVTAADKWVSYDPATNTVTFELIAGPFTFNGHRNGEATLAVPPKANMVINFVNKDGTPHSAEIISGEGPLPNAAGDPAIPRAYTNKVSEGLPQEASDVMRFSVPASGTYRIFCGVPGHGLSGMWIWMKVEPGVKTPSFGPTKA